VVALADDDRLLYKEEVLRESPAVTVMHQYFPTTLLRPLDIKCARNNYRGQHSTANRSGRGLCWFELTDSLELLLCLYCEHSQLDSWFFAAGIFCFAHCALEWSLFSSRFMDIVTNITLIVCCMWNQNKDEVLHLIFYLFLRDVTSQWSRH